MDVKTARLRALGVAIARERERQGLSQEQLSRMIGQTSHAHLSRIESGQKAPNLDMLFALADALDVRVGYFFTRL